MEKCQKCGAELVKNPHTGKIFCSDKCWLKQKSTQVSSDEQKWEQINAKKDHSMNWLNAKRGACELVAAMIQAGLITSGEREAVENTANFLYDLEPQNNKTNQPF